MFPLLLAVVLALIQTAVAADRRTFDNGWLIPDQGYCDQPYIVITEDGNWLCTLTTGPGRESQPGQHVVTTISTNQGRSWSPIIDIEQSGAIERSWVAPIPARDQRASMVARFCTARVP